MLPNSRDGIQRLRGWLAEHEAAEAVIGVENAAGYGRPLCAALSAAGHEVLNVPAWRTHRDRHTSGPGKSDPGDALAIAHVACANATSSGPRWSPS
ncbi:IS110 family transposase [Solirubrobacter soli]|uniref:IS110 family transposase n=1 Tax=Solirubrobacter soli TaxID=363832 RepID=UPI0003F9B34A|nr:transposase [Solirubrobacter soli]